MVYPEETDTWEKSRHIFFDCSMKFLNYVPLKAAQFYLFYIMKCLEKYCLSNNMGQAGSPQRNNHTLQHGEARGMCRRAQSPKLQLPPPGLRP